MAATLTAGETLDLFDCCAHDAGDGWREVPADGAGEVRVEDGAWQGPGGLYFITSEHITEGGRNWRYFTVRRLDVVSGCITLHGKAHAFVDLYDAVRGAEEAAEGPLTPLEEARRYLARHDTDGHMLPGVLTTQASAAHRGHSLPFDPEWVRLLAEAGGAELPAILT